MKKLTILVLLLAMVAGTVFAQRPAADTGGTRHVFSGNGNSYEVVNQSMTWEDARREAERRGGRLATVQNMAANDFLARLILDNGNMNAYWLGGQADRNRRWAWVTGEAFSYTNWAAGQPDNFQGRQDKLIIMRIANPHITGATRGHWDDECGTTANGSGGLQNVGFIIEYSRIPASAIMFNGHGYEVVDQTMTWEDARREAQRRGGDLVTITNRAENDFVARIILDNGRRNAYWLGGLCGADRRFRWVNGSSFSYTNWAPGQPDNWQGRQDRIIIMRVANPHISGATRGHWDDECGTTANGSGGLGNVGFVIKW